METTTFPVYNTISPRHSITRSNTLYLVASIVSQPCFPNDECIPETTPIPFTNFGHQPLLDHDLLYAELINAIKHMQDTLLPWQKYDDTFVYINVLTSVSILMLISVFYSIVLGCMCGGASFFVGYNIITMRTKKYKDKLAETKARLLQKLISSINEQKCELSNNNILSQPSKHYGSGELDTEHIPILTIISNDEPFPGYGRLQLENTLVCRPQPRIKDNIPAIDIIGETVFKKAETTIKQLHLPDVSSGMAITVYGDSITIDSKWLGDDKSPILFVPKDKLATFLEIEDTASYRIYYAIQSIFPEYNSAATFFFRVFLAGNAISCHLALTTIGPPIIDKQLLQKALLRYRLEKSNNNKNELVIPPTYRTVNKRHNSLISAIHSIKALTKDTGSFLDPKLDLSTISNLKIDKDQLSLAEQSEFDSDFKQIVDHSTMWPGTIGIHNDSIRDMNTYSFTPDFYGKPEQIAIIRTLYDQVSRSILDSFDELGFDISDYRNKEGSYSINAEKIDNLVIGEKIHIEKQDTKPESSDNQSQKQQRNDQ